MSNYHQTNQIKLINTSLIDPHLDQLTAAISEADSDENEEDDE